MKVVGKTAKKASSPKAVKGKKTTSKAKNARSSDKGDTETVILDFLFEMHELGMDSVKEEEVLKKTGYARTDSKGYRLPIKKLSKELGYIQKNGGKLELTGEGLRSMESKNGAQKPTTNEEQHEKWKQKLCEMSSAPKKAISAFWGVLLDGKPHSRDELLKATEYKRQDSAGFKSIMKLCKQFGLLEKEKGEHMFSDKMFPFGRP